MDDLLKKYNVQFFKSLLNSNVQPVATGSELADFLTTLPYIDSLDEVLAIVDHHLSGGEFDPEKGTVKSEIHIGWISGGEVVFFGLPPLDNVRQQSVPLQDFRDIVQLWIDYKKELNLKDDQAIRQVFMFNITNGTGDILVGFSDDRSYLKIKKPVTLVWPDHEDSLVRLLCMMPLAPAEREDIQALFTDNLYNDFTKREDDLYQLLKPLCLLLQNGEYDLAYQAGKANANPATGPNHRGEAAYSWSAEYATPVELDQMDELERKYADHLKMHREESDSGLVEFTTSWFYTGANDDSYIATRPRYEIDQERVTYFEKQIADGARPWAMLMRAVDVQDDQYSATFILDGHHKLQAYKNAGLNPPLVIITQHVRHQNEKIFDAEALAGQLYPWQMRHLLNNWDDRDKDRFVIQKLQNPQSPLHKHVRNGTIREYYDNKVLSREAFYVNDKIHGQARSYYNNGQLMSEYYYHQGKPANTWKEYYISGNIQMVRSFSDEGFNVGQSVSYYENGQQHILNEYNDGRSEDGTSSHSWYPDGTKKSEYTYVAGRMTEKKEWDANGKLVKHEVFDTETQSYIKLIAPAPADIQPEGHIYVNTGPTDISDDGIRGNGQDFKYFLIVFIVILLFVCLFWWMGQPL